MGGSSLNEGCNRLAKKVVLPLLRLHDLCGEPEALPLDESGCAGGGGALNNSSKRKQIINDNNLCQKEKRFTCALRT